MICNLCDSITNNILWSSTILHYALHGFRLGRGTGTSTPEETLSQQLARICRDTLIKILLDVQKDYEFLDRGICTKILEGYGLGTILQRLIQRFWDDQAMVPKAGRYY